MRGGNDREEAVGAGGSRMMLIGFKKQVQQEYPGDGRRKIRGCGHRVRTSVWDTPRWSHPRR